MPYLAGIVHLAMAIFFAIHAVKTGRPSWWLFVLLSFPLMGSVIYFFAVFLPDQSNTRGGRRAMRAIQNVLDPEGELREAQLEYDRTPSVQNRSRLAAALLAKGRNDEALAHFRACATGPYANDRAMLMGVAQAELAVGHPSAAKVALDSLFSTHPDARTPEAELLYARTLAATNDPTARSAFEAAVQRLDTIEAHGRLADFLAEAGDAAAARKHYDAVLSAARVVPAHARELNKEWIARAQKATAAG
jgi:hypothetical protein